MASLPSENVYDAQGTVLYRVIRADAHRAQMRGSTAADPAHSDIGALAGEPASAVTFKGVPGIDGGRGRSSGAGDSTLVSSMVGTTRGAGHAGADSKPPTSAAAATASLRAQQQQQQQRAAHARGAAAVPSASSILLPGASKAALIASRRPGRLLPLAGEDPAGTTADGGERGAERGVVTSQTLTAAKALAQLFPPLPVSDTQTSTGQTSSGTVSDAEHGGADDGVRREEPEWVQVAAVDHVSRVDVVLLHQHLAKRCQDAHARPTGSLCATREAIFNDGYRELVRQVTVTCPERGLLMDELDQHMLLSNEAYDSLFDSACQYAARKSIERDLRRHLFDDKAKLESEVRRLENRVNELRAKEEGLHKRFDEHKTNTEKLQEEELSYLKKANQQLVSEIKRLSTLESAMHTTTKAAATEGA